MPGKSQSKKQQAAAEEPVQTTVLVQAQLRKTALCKFHMAGRCRMGTKCDFAHNASEIREGPNLNKTSLCATFMKGQTCKNSAQCPFAHGKRELRATNMFQANRSNKKMPGSSEQQEDAGLQNQPSECRPAPAKLPMTPGPMFQAIREEEPSHPHRDRDAGHQGEYPQMAHYMGRVPPQGMLSLASSEEHNNMVPPSRGNGARLTNAEFVMESRPTPASPIASAEVMQLLRIPLSKIPMISLALNRDSGLALERFLNNAAPEIYED